MDERREKDRSGITGRGAPDAPPAAEADVRTKSFPRSGLYRIQYPGDDFLVNAVAPVQHPTDPQPRSHAIARRPARSPPVAAARSVHPLQTPSMSFRTNQLGQPIGDSVLAWRPPPPPPRTPMVGRYGSLAPLDPAAHAAGLFDAFAEDREGRNWTYLLAEPFDSLDRYRAFLEAHATGDDPMFFTILDRAERPVGVASYLRVAPSAGSIEVGHIHYSNRMQRTPLATEAMYLMMKRVFELGFRRYEWKCDSLNAPSRAAALRLGFSFEGVFRQALVYKGRNRDTAWYSVIDSEWPALRAAYEAWLDPANFDADGRQRRRLSELTRPMLVTVG